MKKLTFTLAAPLLAAIPSMAEDTTVKTLYEGEPKEVTWENTLTIPADQFADNINIGDYIYITFSKTTDVIEIKANGTWLPGSRLTQLGDNSTDFKAYITTDMLAALKEYGMEICGASFTVTGVSIRNDGFNMPENAIWGGYFWVDNWNTLEIFKSAFANYKDQRYMNIYLSDDVKDYTGYFMKVLTKWDPETVWANNDQIKHENKLAVVDLKDIKVAESLAAEGVNAVMIQGNKEAGDPFNIVAVTLTNDDVTTGVDNIIGNEGNVLIDVYNLQGVKVRSLVPSETATEGLPAGMYIAGDKKLMVK